MNFGLLAVFVGSGGIIQPGINTSATPFVSSTTTPRNIPTDIAEDRFIPDNTDPNGDFGVPIKL